MPKIKRKVKSKAKAVPQSRKPITEEERDLMLLWYTFYDGNCNKTAVKISEITGHKRHRKVVYETAKKYNFDVLAHVVRDQVNQKFYGSDTPGMGRVLKLTADVLEIEEDLMLQCKRYIQNMPTKIGNIDQLLKVLTHVTKDLSAISGEPRVKEAAFKKIAEEEGERISVSLNQVTDNMRPEDKKAFVKDLVDQQMSKILDLKGHETENTRERARKEDEVINKSANKYGRADLRKVEGREHRKRKVNE